MLMGMRKKSTQCYRNLNSTVSHTGMYRLKGIALIAARKKQEKHIAVTGEPRKPID
jgi:hypothetical protein